MELIKLNHESKPFLKIDHNYQITEKEIKKLLGIKGEITSMHMYSGTIPDNYDHKTDKNIWEITSIETKSVK